MKVLSNDLIEVVEGAGAAKTAWDVGTKIVLTYDLAQIGRDVWNSFSWSGYSAGGSYGFW